MDCTLQKCCTFLAACVFDVLITMCWCPETPFAPPGPHTACCCWRVCCLWLPLRRRLRALLLRLHAVRLRPGCECHHGCGSDATSIAAAAVAVASGAAAVASIAAAAALSAAALHSYCATTAAATAAAQCSKLHNWESPKPEATFTAAPATVKCNLHSGPINCEVQPSQWPHQL